MCGWVGVLGLGYGLFRGFGNKVENIAIFEGDAKIRRVRGRGIFGVSWVLV